jgi:hypothetical protein
MEPMFVSHSTRSPQFQTDQLDKFRACLEDEILSNPSLPDEVAVNTYGEKLSSAISKALAESTSRSHPHDDLDSPIMSHSHNEIRLNNWLRKQWKIMKEPTLKV